MRWRRVVYGGHRRRHARRSSTDSGGGLLILAIVVFGLLSYAASYVGWPAVIVAVVLVAVLIGRYLIRKATLSTPKAQDLSLALQNVGAMSGGQFEVFVAQVLRALGYRTTVLGGSGDQVRNHRSPTIHTAKAAAATTGLMRLTTHPLHPAVPGGSLRLQFVSASQGCL